MPSIFFFLVFLVSYLFLDLRLILDTISFFLTVLPPDRTDSMAGHDRAKNPSPLALPVWHWSSLNWTSLRAYQSVCWFMPIHFCILSILSKHKKVFLFMFFVFFVFFCFLSSAGSKFISLFEYNARQVGCAWAAPNPALAKLSLSQT